MTIKFELLIAVLLLFILFQYLRKKLKKYKIILDKNGFDGIYYYFINKNIIKTGFSNFIDKKKNSLGLEISKYSKQKILYGPYKGTKIINTIGWSNVDFASKYLGVYESHIQEKIIYLSKKYRLKYFIDLGAAEGYHAVSLIKKNYFLKAIAFEIDESSRILLKKNSQLNKLSNKIEIFGDANFISIKKNLPSKLIKNSLFLVDIEGNEFSLFNNEFCKYFSKSFFIIEDHNFNIVSKKKIKMFYQMIKKYFKVEIIKDCSKDPLKYKILDRFSDDEKYLMMSEGRPETMSWIILYPKTIKNEY
jgi:hypothetical protein